MPYCDICDRDFNTDDGLLQHRIHSSRHIFCASCQREFSTYHGREQHYINSSSHNYCEWCEEDFDTSSDLDKHDDEEHESCEPCDMLFRNSEEFDEHIEEYHWYCYLCRRFFRNENNLTQHLKNSGTHKSKNYVCPGRGCKKPFVSWSALVLHFEAGTCPSGLNRHELNKLVTKYDRKNLIMNPSRLITGPSGTQQPSAPRKLLATERSYNGSYYECFLCHSEFGALNSLNQHLQSPKHEDKIYRCPNRKCGIEYSALSSLTQHVENGHCGVSRFKDVKNIMDSLTGRIKTLTL